jgi:hypothetical protein
MRSSSNAVAANSITTPVPSRIDERTPGPLPPPVPGAPLGVGPVLGRAGPLAGGAVGRGLSEPPGAEGDGGCADADEPPPVPGAADGDCVGVGVPVPAPPPSRRTVQPVTRSRKRRPNTSAPATAAGRCPSNVDLTCVRMASDPSQSPGYSTFPLIGGTNYEPPRGPRRPVEFCRRAGTHSAPHTYLAVERVKAT